MSEGFEALSEREKQTLRLLLAGHDIKSIAGALGLSVHTVSERLREARRKLGASSSRQAARLLAEIEGHAEGRAPAPGPSFSGDRRSGVAGPAAGGADRGRSDRRHGAGLPLAWLGGGMLVMSLIIAAVVLSQALHGPGGTAAAPRAGDVTLAAANPASAAPDPAAADAARAWLALIDGQRWAESWGAAGSMFKASLTEAAWASKVAPVREPLGAVVSRRLQTATRSASLPGAPDNDYEIIQFSTDFAHRPASVETVVLAHEGVAWKVIGYFVK